MKKKISLLLALIILFSACLLGCNDNTGYKDPTETFKLAETDDKYRNYYQIWVWSFCDSNNDEIGDIQGIISKLDYLNDGDPTTDTDLGITGIWLSPIMPSKSYHKYDVKDYYGIDEEFGTMADFEQLISECDKRGIKVIIDLVLNHCSSQHPWFNKACEELAKGNWDGYAKYFDFYNPDDKTRDPSLDDNYKLNQKSGRLYEANFSSEMPEWDLTYKGTRDEFEKISKFWLEKGVAGFRLDAIKYLNNDHTDGVEFMKWFYEASKKYNPDVYMVGENWDSTANIYDMYESGIDSQFAFKLGTNSGEYATAARSGLVGEKFVGILKKYDENIKKRNKNAINAVFLSNHDMVRSANALVTIPNMKMAASLYLMTPGNTYTYYGEEIGTLAPFTDNDAAYRTAMVWDSDNFPSIYVNSVGVVDESKYGGVKQQDQDENSLLNFYKRAFKIKNQNPEIARGSITQIVKFDDDSVGAYYIEYEGKKLLIVHNTSSDEEKTLTITDEILKNAEFRGDLVGSDPIENEKGEKEAQHVLFKDGVLTMPKQSTAILKAVE